MGRLVKGVPTFYINCTYKFKQILRILFSLVITLKPIKPTWHFLLIKSDVNLMWTIFTRSERNIEEIIAFGFDFGKGCCLLSTNIHSQGSFTSITAVN